MSGVAFFAAIQFGYWGLAVVVLLWLFYTSTRAVTSIFARLKSRMIFRTIGRRLDLSTDEDGALSGVVTGFPIRLWVDAGSLSLCVRGIAPGFALRMRSLAEPVTGGITGESHFDRAFEVTGDPLVAASLLSRRARQRLLDVLAPANVLNVEDGAMHLRTPVLDAGVVRVVNPFRRDDEVRDARSVDGGGEVLVHLLLRGVEERRRLLQWHGLSLSDRAVPQTRRLQETGDGEQVVVALLGIDAARARLAERRCAGQRLARPRAGLRREDLQPIDHIVENVEEEVVARPREPGERRRLARREEDGEVALAGHELVELRREKRAAWIRPAARGPRRAQRDQQPLAVHVGRRVARDVDLRELPLLATHEDLDVPEGMAAHEKIAHEARRGVAIAGARDVVGRDLEHRHGLCERRPARPFLDDARVARLRHRAGSEVGADVEVVRVDPPGLRLRLLAAWNLGREGAEWQKMTADQRAKNLVENRDAILPLTGCTLENLFDEAGRDASSWNLPDFAPGLRTHPVLVISADDGGAADSDALVASIRAASNRNVTSIHLATDHAFSGRRIAVASEVVTWLGSLDRHR